MATTNGPKFLALVTTLLNPLEDIDTCTKSFVQAFDIDQAVGVQLDTIGTIVGVSRTLPFQPSGGVSPILDDTTYRTLLKATIALNQWNGLMTSVQPLWASIFPGGHIVVQDNLDMTMTVTLSGSFSSVIQDMIAHDMIVPRPEGVLMNFIYGTMPFFGFDLDNGFIGGFDHGHWA